MKECGQYSPSVIVVLETDSSTRKWKNWFIKIPLRLAKDELKKQRDLIIQTPLTETATAAEKATRTKALNQAKEKENQAIEAWAAGVDLMMSPERRLNDVRKMNDVPACHVSD